MFLIFLSFVFLTTKTGSFFIGTQQEEHDTERSHSHAQVDFQQIQTNKNQQLKKLKETEKIK